MYYNDNTTKKSTLISISDVAEITGISADEFSEKYDNDIEKLSADLYNFDFSHTPKYPNVTERECVATIEDLLSILSDYTEEEIKDEWQWKLDRGIDVISRFFTITGAKSATLDGRTYPAVFDLEGLRALQV